jgi:hypothetical protein
MEAGLYIGSYTTKDFEKVELWILMATKEFEKVSFTCKRYYNP